MAVTNRAVFIDKDGTLVNDVPYNCDPNLLSFTAHVVEGLRLLQTAGFELFVVSNQSGIARGYFDELIFLRLAMSLVERLEDEGIVLHGVYYCPHHPEGIVSQYAIECDCRKPRPGMILRAAAQNGIDLASSYLVGDILDDIEAGKQAGVRTILIDNGGETEWRRSPLRTPDFTAGDLLEAAQLILADAGAAQRWTNRARGLYAF